MAKITNELLVENNRVFFPSKNINIFPCSRRGQYSDSSKNKSLHYDPEARLNTERTNRLHTAVNGFKDSFIINESFTAGDTLVFVLKGYYIEVKNFDPLMIATAFDTSPTALYAHLSLHTGISLNVEGYVTEILYRQSTKAADIQYLDVSYEDKDFFVGVSFTADESAEDNVSEGEFGEAIPYFLPLFSYINGTWQLEQTSLLPKVEHGETENSVKIPGDGGLTVDHDITVHNDLTVSNNLTVDNEADLSTVNIKNKLTAPEINATTKIDAEQLTVKTSTTTKNLTVTGSATTDSLIASSVNADEITQNGNTVPAITLEKRSNPERYQLQIMLDGSQTIEN